ncbi:hypothetical protein D9Q98_004916 [Chlorella vulgaris]|uniref:Uncharacterized protein n=1 Tax=Chlorella vulgaris TaxID=3077 RepID=A0A9D4TN37_CHLVU|nr:hypothetical protein D9Q98_004916 [Chlorella vulgaris]
MQLRVSGTDVLTGAGMERAGVQQEAALETAAPPTVKRQQEQHIQAPAYISPRDPRLQLSGLADMQARTTPAQPLHPGSVAAAVDSGSPVSADTTAASSSGGEEESWEEGEQARPPSQAPAAPQQQAAPVQPPLPGPPVQHRVPATNVSANGFAEAGQRQHLQALSQQQQQPQGANPDAAGKTVPEQPALLPLQTFTTQALTGLLVLEAAQRAAVAAAGLTEGLAGTFAALLPMPAEQDECLRLMLQRRQYSGAAGLMRAVLHVRGIPAPGLSQPPPKKL